MGNCKQMSSMLTKAATVDIVGKANVFTEQAEFELGRINKISPKLESSLRQSTESLEL